MPLALFEIIKTNYKIDRSFENMGNEFVLVNICVNLPPMEKSYFNKRPFHWRIGNGRNPPLDISLESNEGFIKEISFFIADDKILPVLEEKEFKVEEGFPKLGHNFLENECYSIDEEGNVEFTYLNDELYCIFSKSDVAFNLKLSDFLECIFDSKNNLIGLILKRITLEEKEVLKEANLI